jgi:hypothetical protein
MQNGNKGRKHVVIITLVAWPRTVVTSFPPVLPVKQGILISIYLALLAGTDWRSFYSFDSSLPLLDVVPFPFQDERLSLSPPEIVPGSRTQ